MSKSKRTTAPTSSVVDKVSDLEKGRSLVVVTRPDGGRRAYIVATQPRRSTTKAGR